MQMNSRVAIINMQVQNAIQVRLLMLRRTNDEIRCEVVMFKESAKKFVERWRKNDEKLKIDPSCSLFVPTFFPTS